MRNMVSNLEIDAQKRVIYRYKSPFNFIFEPEFSTGSPVGDPDLVARIPKGSSEASPTTPSEKTVSFMKPTKNDLKIGHFDKW